MIHTRHRFSSGEGGGVSGKSELNVGGTGDAKVLILLLFI
jgi:hypothetical protein